YLSSAHVGQDPAYTPQHGPAVPAPVGSAEPAAAPAVPPSSSFFSSSSSLSKGGMCNCNVYALAECPSGGVCSKLPAACFTCAFHHNCSYGKPHNFTCTAKEGVHCVYYCIRKLKKKSLDVSERQQTVFNLTVDCQFFLAAQSGSVSLQHFYHLHDCVLPSQALQRHLHCPGPRKLLRHFWTIKLFLRFREFRDEKKQKIDRRVSLGKREFQKRLFCNWTGGYKWTTALTLSITLGGFGADRFYLGQWREGLGKLFSFGGLGIWTLIDVLLIAVGYVGPADGSLYI
ncbi:hypothetical protein QTP86_032402, partial [Hemibagrus guttatus]